MSYQGPSWRATQRLPRLPAPPPPDRYRPAPQSRQRPQRPRPRRRPGRVVAGIVAMIVLLVVASAGYVDWSLRRADALADYPDRLGATAGTNWLIVGSDSRAGLTPAEEAQLSTGDAAAAAGGRTDTIMLMHLPSVISSNVPTLVSLPRDSSVPVPGYGRIKLNATFALGGPALLVQTVEKVTGVHVDHYAEIGFGGFAGVVDDVGGVQMCPTKPISDPLAGLHIQAGCQVLDGAQALGYVRTRHSPRGDLDRVVRQREFLGALISRISSPAVLLNPFRVVPLVADAPSTITVDNGDHIWSLARLGWAMRSLSNGHAVTTTVPIAGFGSVSDGSSAVLWDRKQAAALFQSLARE